MTFSLSLRPRAFAEITAARAQYASVGHGDQFVREVESLVDAIQAMPLRFPTVYGEFIALCYADTLTPYLSHSTDDRTYRCTGRSAATRESEALAGTLDDLNDYRGGFGTDNESRTTPLEFALTRS